MTDMHTMDKERRSIFDRFGLNRNRAGNPGETDTGNPDEKTARKARWCGVINNPARGSRGMWIIPQACSGKTRTCSW